jgi:hypothetical protein
VTESLSKDEEFVHLSAIISAVEINIKEEDDQETMLNKLAFILTDKGGLAESEIKEFIVDVSSYL